MDAYDKLRIKELRDKINTCDCSDSSNLINITQSMFELLQDLYSKYVLEVNFKQTII